MQSMGPLVMAASKLSASRVLATGGLAAATALSRQPAALPVADGPANSVAGVIATRPMLSSAASTAEAAREAPALRSPSPRSRYILHRSIGYVFDRPGVERFGGPLAFCMAVMQLHGRLQKCRLVGIPLCRVKMHRFVIITVPRLSAAALMYFGFSAPACLVLYLFGTTSPFWTSNAIAVAVPIVAEGIEALEAANALQLMGCELGQGWLYGRPMLAEDVAALLRHAESDPTPAVDSILKSH